MPVGTFRYALILGLLSCISPLAIDMFLPAMPTIGADLGATVAATQGTITWYFVSFGLAQMIYGPWADQSGRKLPMYVGITVFLVGSLACAAAPSIGWLVAGRFLQGLGGAVLMVVPRAIIRDMHTGPAATRLMATLMLVISISPFLAPLAGSALIAVWDWRAIFIVLGGAAAVSLGMTLFLLPETLHRDLRVPVNARSLWHGSKLLLSDRTFMGLTFLGGFAMASFFVFIASAAFVYTSQFGLSPTGFSLAFAVNALGFFGSSQFAASAGEKFGTAVVVAVATAGFACCTFILLALALAGAASLPVVIGGLFAGNAFLGLVIPSTMVMALDDHGEIAGLASSLGGTLQMLVGGAMISLTGPFFDGTVVPMLAAIALCGLAALILSRLVLGKRAVVA